MKDEPISAMRKEVEVAGDDLSLMLKVFIPENMEEDKKDYDFDSVQVNILWELAAEYSNQFTSRNAWGGNKRACLKKNQQQSLWRSGLFRLKEPIRNLWPNPSSVNWLSSKCWNLNSNFLRKKFHRTWYLKI